MGFFSIGQVATRAGLETSAIRYYERIGLLPPPERINGIRRYDADIFGRLGVIQLARRAGFTIAEIRALLHDFPAEMPPAQRWSELAPKKIAELDALIHQALTMRKLVSQTLDCHCVTLEQCAGG